MKRFDVLIVSDCRFPGGTSTAVAHELRALRSAGHSVGLYHVNSVYLGRDLGVWHRDILAEADRGSVQVLSEGDVAEAGVLFVHNPWIVPDLLPTRLTAALRILIAHHPPANARGRLNYDPRAIERHARRAFGGKFVWAPISPVCRDAFDAVGLPFPRLRMDWNNLLFVDDWGAARSGLLGNAPIIGRHSQPRTEKWPDTRETLFQVYPNGGDIQVRLMGLSQSVKELVGEYPDNWQTMEPNEIPVRKFLSGIDFFVYFHHSDWLEAYGRTIAEAAAAGCVVVLPPYLKRTFGDAGLYCEPVEALDLVRKVALDRERFANLSARGRRVIEVRFGLASYLDRLQGVLAAACGDRQTSEVVEPPLLDLPTALHAQVKRTSFFFSRALARSYAMKPKRALRKQLKRLRRRVLDRRGHV